MTRYTTGVSEMESLISQVQQWGSKVDFWSTAVNILLFATALVGVLYFAATIRQSTVAKRLRTAEEELVKAKDEKLTQDLKAKDLEIAAADQKSSEANERSKRLEQENLKLEAAISPRRLTERQQKALASLAAFHGRIVEITSYVGDSEGLILASQIKDSLDQSRLAIVDNRLSNVPSGAVIFGVAVHGTNADLVGAIKSILSMDGHLATESLLPVQQRGSLRFNVLVPATPPAVIIQVGAKPIK
jgi:outer membrane murein-binding lipoprotein Lpp